ncbi:MAG: hypothetical protein JF616_20860 [Fibrobacteres bacterium]|jgi:hypothetical protein|nr:hypothetical protein [Fibrobacterota bacterium]
MTDIPAHPGRAMYLYGVLGIAATAAYFGFAMLDSRFLPEQRASALVTAKHFVPSGTTYRTQVVGNQNLTLPMETGDGYLIYLEVEGKAAGLGVAKPVFDSLAEGARVDVVYSRRRFTGRIDVKRLAEEK